MTWIFLYLVITPILLAVEAYGNAVWLPRSEKKRFERKVAKIVAREEHREQLERSEAIRRKKIG